MSFPNDISTTNKPSSSCMICTCNAKVVINPSRIQKGMLGIVTWTNSGQSPNILAEERGSVQVVQEVQTVQAVQAVQVQAGSTNRHTIIRTWTEEECVLGVQFFEFLKCPCLF